MPKAKYKIEKSTGYYYVYVPTGRYTAKGKPEYIKLRGKTQAILDKKVEETKKNLIFNVEPTKMTVDDWYNEWIISYKAACRENTINFYKRLYSSHIKNQIGNILVSKVSESQCQSILSEMSKDYSEKTVKDTRSVLFSLFETAKRNKIIVINPAEKLDAKGKKAKNRRHLTDDERKKYLKACKTHPFGQYAALLYFFGLRRGEAVAVCGSDFDGNVLHVTKQYTYPNNYLPVPSDLKTESGLRDVPIPPKAKKYINFDNMPDGLLFADDKGNPLTYSQLTSRWDSFIKSALGDDTEVTPHYLRHNYCCMLIEANLDLKSIQMIAGHTDIETTLNIYTHYTEELKKKNEKLIVNIG